jgi:hypothetical protein
MLDLYLTPATKAVIAAFVDVLIHDHTCRQDLVMMVLYLLAAVTVIYWHHCIWVVYLMAAAYAFAVMEALGIA